MKGKFFLLVVVCVAVALMASSCKTHERCPAYGKANSPKTEKRA